MSPVRSVTYVSGPDRKIVEPRVGVEPTTCRLRIGCSTTELPRPDSCKSFYHRVLVLLSHQAPSNLVHGWCIFLNKTRNQILSRLSHLVRNSRESGLHLVKAERGFILWSSVHNQRSYVVAGAGKNPKESHETISDCGLRIEVCADGWSIERSPIGSCNSQLDMNIAISRSAAGKYETQLNGHIEVLNRNTDVRRYSVIPEQREFAHNFGARTFTHEAGVDGWERHWQSRSNYGVGTNRLIGPGPTHPVACVADIAQNRSSGGGETSRTEIQKGT